MQDYNSLTPLSPIISPNRDVDPYQFLNIGSDRGDSMPRDFIEEDTVNLKSFQEKTRVVLESNQKYPKFHLESLNPHFISSTGCTASSSQENQSSHDMNGASNHCNEVKQNLNTCTDYIEPSFSPKQEDEFLNDMTIDIPMASDKSDHSSPQLEEIYIPEESDERNSQKFRDYEKFTIAESPKSDYSGDYMSVITSSCTPKTRKPRAKKGEASAQNALKNFAGLVQQVNKTNFLNGVKEYLDLYPMSQEERYEVAAFLECYNKQDKTWAALERYYKTNTKCARTALHINIQFLSPENSSLFDTWLSRGRMKPENREILADRKDFFVKGFTDLLYNLERSEPLRPPQKSQKKVKKN